MRMECLWMQIPFAICLIYYFSDTHCYLMLVFRHIILNANVSSVSGSNWYVENNHFEATISFYRVQTKVKNKDTTPLFWMVNEHSLFDISFDCETHRVLCLPLISDQSHSTEGERELGTLPHGGGETTHTQTHTNTHTHAVRLHSSQPRFLGVSFVCCEVIFLDGETIATGV